MVEATSAARAPRIVRVGEVLARVRAAVADAIPPCWIAGEIRNLRRAASGHVYFTLGDEDGQLRCALFRRDAARVPFDLEDGIEVIAFGEVGVYEARGDLQLIVRQLEPRGQGALQLAFDQLRKRLEGEGLFDPERKRELPVFPAVVGLVTSTSGAALQDILRILRERGPALRVVIAPARVQGAGADLEILQAMQRLCAHGEADLIVLARGGGSLEDLWCWNSEALARGISRCPLPVVTGIGHETDLTIADLCADRRAPTPSGAAVEAFPDRRAWRARVEHARARVCRALIGELGQRREQVVALRRTLRGLSPGARLATRRARFGELRRTLRGVARAALRERLARAEALAGALVSTPVARGFQLERRGVEARAERVRAALQGRLRDAREALALSATRLDTLSPLAVLGRGYAIAIRTADGAILRAPSETAPGDRLRLRLAGGDVGAEVTEVPDEG